MNKFYPPPTWRNYTDSAEQWKEWKRQANLLPNEDLKRHASVSVSNRHRCHNCFCCAALELLDEKRSGAR